MRNFLHEEKFQTQHYLGQRWIFLLILVDTPLQAELSAYICETLLDRCVYIKLVTVDFWRILWPFSVIIWRSDQNTVLLS